MALSDWATLQGNVSRGYPIPAFCLLKGQLCNPLEKVSRAYPIPGNCSIGNQCPLTHD
jgi:hypothetical protein